jgi:hypothetical protein
VLVAVGVPIVAKAHEIAKTNKRLFGSYLKMDGHVIRECLAHNARGTLLAGGIAGVVFFGGTWVSKVMAERSESHQVQSTQSR